MNQTTTAQTSVQQPNQQANLLDEAEFDLASYWRTLVRRKKQIILLALALTLLSMVVVSLMTPVYRATATLLVESNRAKLLSIDEVFSQVSSTRAYFETQAAILKSRTVADLVIANLHLDTDPMFDPRQQPKSWKQKLRDALGLSKPAHWTEQGIQDAIAGELMSNMAIAPVPQTRLIKVSYYSPSPAVAAKIANAIAKAYIQDNTDAQFRRTREAASWLNQQLQGLKANVDKSEQALQDYRDKEHIVNTQGLAQMGTVQQISDLTQSLVNAKAAVASAQSNYQQVSNATIDDLASLPVVQDNPTISVLVQQEAKAKSRVAELSKVYGPKHPKMQAAESELAQTKASLKTQIHLVALSLKRQYEAAQRREQAIADTLARLKNSMYSLNRKEFQLQALQRDVTSNQSLYDSFLKRLKETMVSQDNQLNVVAQIVDPARQPGAPAKPHKSRIVAIALVIGLFLGSLVALLLERLDNAINSSEDAETKLGKPVLASLPQMVGSNSNALYRYFNDHPQTVFSEGVSAARTSILLSSIDEDSKTLIVTSSFPSEGKTTTAINLALAIAHNKKVLLVDGDMRRPSIVKTLGLKSGLPGLSNLVAGEAPRIHTIDGSSMNILGAGDMPPDPIDLILSQKFSKAMAVLKKNYDVIIIDSPPVQLVSDAVALSTHASGTIFVVKAGDTPHQVARRSIDKLSGSGANVIGVVVNQLDFKRADQDYGAYSSYGVTRYDGYYTKAT